jgi:SAM-dependent methyltransferase
MKLGFDGLGGAVYSWYMEHPAVSKAIGRVAWGGDVEPHYASMAAVADVPDGGVIVDAPCGTAPALEHWPRGRTLRYVALDNSLGMLDRAGERAARLRLSGVELVRGDATAIPLADGAADLFLSLFGLHCFTDPEAGVREIGRCLRPGGRTVVSMICKGPGLRRRLMVQPDRGGFGPTGTAADLDRWLGQAGLDVERRELSGPFAYVTAVRAA